MKRILSLMGVRTINSKINNYFKNIKHKIVTENTIINMKNRVFHSMLSIGIIEHLLDSLIFLKQYLSFAKGSMFDY